MSSLRQQTLKTWQSDPPSFADYLPYLTCVDQAVLLVDRLGQAPSIGGLWELDPVCVEGAPEERWESVSSAMDGLLARLPEDAAVQFYLLGDPHIGEELATFTRHGAPTGVIGAACADRVRLYAQSRETPLFAHKGVPFRCRRVRAYCSVRVWPQPTRRTGRRGQAAFDAWLTQAQSEFAAVEQVLAGSTKIVLCRQRELILFLFRLAFPRKERAPGRLHSFSEFFPTPGEDRFCGDAFQRLFDDVWSGVGDECT
jgi:TraC protein